MKDKGKRDPTQTVKAWLNDGVLTVPIAPHSKVPRGGKGWNTLRITEKTISKHFKKGDNIGALWGKPSNWVVDVDLDIPEACTVARYLLPETFIYGRPSNPYSHYLYRSRDCPTTKFTTKDTSMVVEIRSTGSQSIIPPSLHPDDNEYFHIEEDLPFTEIAKSELLKLAVEVAVAALFLRNYPIKGSGRHDYVHACTGCLLWAAWKTERITRVMGALLKAIGSSDEELEDRIVTVNNTIEHHQQGNKIAGFPTLENYISEICITQLRKWMQEGARPLAIMPATSPAVKKEKGADGTGFKEEWLKIPGHVGDVAKWSTQEAYIQQPIFALAVGIMCTALASSNHYIVSERWQTPLQPYLMLLAGTGQGKGAVLKSITQYAQKIGLEDDIYRGFQSYHAMLDQLAERGRACWLWDEVGRHMASAKNPGSPDYQVISHVIALYGQGDSFLAGSPARKNPIPALERPFFTLLATTQPEQLSKALDSTSEITGFTNRFILMDSEELSAPKENENRTTLFPSKISAYGRKLRYHHAKREDLPTIINFASNKVYHQFMAFSKRCLKRTFAGQPVWARGNQNALILAGCAAVGVSIDRPIITEELATWAIDIVTWSNSRWYIRTSLAGDTFFERDSLRMEAKIRNPMSCIKSAQTVNQRKLITAGWMPRTVLLKTVRMSERSREEILSYLLDAHIIEEGDKQGTQVYWCTSDH